MGATSKRLASVVVALTLSGTPALLAACALLCVTAPAHAAAAAPASPHAACCGPEGEAPPAGHAHHGAHGGTAMPSAVGVVPGPLSQMTGADESCCPDDRTATLATTATGRTDGFLVTASPAEGCVTTAARQPTGTARTGRLDRPLRAPTRPPLVLRI